jgi:lysozyme
MDRIIGPDVSFYQDDPYTPVQINFDVMKGKTDFVIIRAGQGNWSDPDFEYNWENAGKVGLLRGAYFLYDSRQNPLVQAQKLKDTLKDRIPEIGIWMDFEERYNGPYSSENNFKAFAEKLKLLYPNFKYFGVYTAYYYWLERIKDFSYWSQYSLWIANYKTSIPRVPAPWAPDNWLFWQFTDSGDGASYGVESSRIDLNFFNGDLTKLKQRFGLEVVIPPTTKRRFELRVDDKIVWEEKL